MQDPSCGLRILQNQIKAEVNDKPKSRLPAGPNLLSEAPKVIQNPL